jgi:hypothetical protein
MLAVGRQTVHSYGAQIMSDQNQILCAAIPASYNGLQEMGSVLPDPLSMAESH